MSRSEWEGRPLVTEDDLRRDLAALGLREGMTLTVHSSLSAIGWVLGGAESAVRALIDAVGDRGTLVMPAATPWCADPETWAVPRIPAARLAEVRESLPVFDPRTTPTSMGAIAEAFRTWPGTLRSRHPVESVSARGPFAEEITRHHPLAFSEGVEGPFGRLHELESSILLLGVGFNRCTALHFAESLVEHRRTTTVRFPIVENGRRVWKEVSNVADDNDTLFPDVGAAFVAQGRAKQGSVGEATSSSFSMRDLVAFSVAELERILGRGGRPATGPETGK